MAMHGHAWIKIEEKLKVWGSAWPCIAMHVYAWMKSKKKRIEVWKNACRVWSCMVEN